MFADLRSHFRPEFLNRVDEIVLFKPLTLEELERIVDLQIEAVRSRLIEQRLELELTEPARVLVARNGYDPVYGARPLRRYIQREVETRIARALLSGEIGPGSAVVVDAEDDQVVVHFEGADGTRSGARRRERGRGRVGTTARARVSTAGPRSQHVARPLHRPRTEDPVVEIHGVLHQPATLPQLWITAKVVPHLPGSASSVSASRRSEARSSSLTASSSSGSSATLN